MSLPIGMGLLCSLLLSAADPQGARDISLALGQTWRAAVPVAAEVVCDDPAVVQGVRAHGTANFTGLREGETLCAVRAVSGTPVAAFHFTVIR
jgi:hypothetical protein